jgi:hypothetical protein
MPKHTKDILYVDSKLYKCYVKFNAIKQTRTSRSYFAKFYRGSLLCQHTHNRTSPVVARWFDDVISFISSKQRAYARCQY